VHLPQSLWPTVYRLESESSWPPATAADASRFVATTIREHLFSLLAADAAIPAIVRDAVSKQLAMLRLFEKRDRDLIAATQRLATLLAEEPFIFLKGSDFRFRLYDSSSLRQMQDIDILVPRNRIDAVCRLLQPHATRVFPAGPVSRLASYPERVFQLDNAIVEVHHSFLHRIRHTVDYDEVFRRSVALNHNEINGRRLADPHAFVYQCITIAAKDQMFVRMIRYIDLWLMAQANPEVWEEACQTAARWSCRNAFYAAIRRATTLIPELRTERSERSLYVIVAPMRARFLDRHVLTQSTSRLTGRPLQVWRKFWLIDRMWRRVAFAVYHAYAVVIGRVAAALARP
jgi:Uncharacterised nucleotidyltransferase